jgi:2-succinyl-6-hydroxy-2,4-cyclohexadiene-1-carboxylate synthase
VSLNVRTDGEGPPLLLLHGFTGSARSWSAQSAAWAASYRVIAPDLLGHGGSEAPVDPSRYALPRQADDVADLLALVDALPCAVVGYSMGARLALVLALTHPDVVDRLVLESPSAGITDPFARAERLAADARLADDLERDGIGPFVDHWQSLPLFASHARLPVEARAALRAERLSHDPRGLAGSLRGAGQGAMEPLAGRLGQIGVATLVVAGALDHAAVDRARDVARAIPDARLVVVSDAGHTPHLEAPDAFRRLVDQHLTVSQATH